MDSQVVMTRSAFMGTPPANERDLLIVQGLQKFNGRGHLNASRGTHTIRPPNPRPWDSNAPKIIASSIIAMVVVLVITSIRIVGKIRAKRSRLGWDDWLIIFASFCFFVFAACDIQNAVDGGIGKHIYNVTYDEMEARSGWAAATWFIYFFVIIPCKLSVICFNARLTGLISNYWRWVHRVLFLAVCIYGAFYIPFYTFGLMTPVRARFSYIETAKAPNFRILRPNRGSAAQAVSASIHVGTDWVLLAIPAYLVLKLQMPMLKKVRCIVPLSVGCLSCIGAIYSLYLKYHMQYDPCYSYYINNHWRNIDLVCALIATSLPAVASVIGAYIRLPPSLAKYFSDSDNTPPVFRSNITNPFAHEGTDDVPLSSMGNGNAHGYGQSGNKSTNRNRYEEHGGSIVTADEEDPERAGSVDITTSRVVAPWEKDVGTDSSSE